MRPEIDKTPTICTDLSVQARQAMTEQKPDWDAIAAETAQATKERHEEAKRIAAAESGMLDAASEWTRAWRIIAQALKELRCPDCDGNARAIIARLAAENMLIVGVENVKD